MITHNEQEQKSFVDWRTIDDDLVPVVCFEDGTEQPAIWAPQPGSQQAFLECPLYEVLYEGNRGPGKTDALLVDFGQHVGQGWGEDWRGILFRQTFPQLTDVIAKSRKLFKRVWPKATFNESKSFWQWPDGEILYFRIFQRESDYWDYHGHAYPWIGWEELCTWPDSKCYKVMMSCSRSARPGMPRKYRSTCNPYGPGHNWVKTRFALPCPPNKLVGKIIDDDVDEDGSVMPARVAIHGELKENRILLHAEPNYVSKIRAAARNKAEADAWIKGSWDIVAGGMFDDVWSPEHHVLPDFVVPHSWMINRSFDWGSSKPFAVGWWAESDGTDLQLPDGRVMSTVRGDLFRIKEWYGWNGQPNEGLRMTAAEIAAGIVEREVKWGLHHRCRPGPADSSIFDVQNGVSIAVDMLQPVRLGQRRYSGVNWTPADKRPGSRKNGWDLMRSRFKAATQDRPREVPGLFVCESCTQFCRTVPVLPRDIDKDPDDVDTSSEDHIADEARYRVASASIRVSGGRTAGV